MPWLTRWRSVSTSWSVSSSASSSRALDRQYGGDGVEFFGAALDGGQ
ncbi:hypothetical protein GR257_37650 [Rhizobium leguminosarum]|uniref:Uncharacterized protein n=1 Tax=Rhizobium leguminosarum TaxID=384 RepID=A0A7K3VVF4_RHILE|nr:hypothetical protein [Rhizobium leguminosarum]